MRQTGSMASGSMTYTSSSPYLGGDGVVGQTLRPTSRTLSTRQSERSADDRRPSVSGSRVLRENVVEHEIQVPRKRIVEETVEKTIIVPETIQREEVVQESMVVRERIVEVAKPIYQEKVVEVPEIEYREKVVEVPEKIVQEKIKQVPRIEIQEHITYVPKIITREKIVEIPEVEVREVPFEKLVEVPEIKEEVVIKEIQVPRYVEVPIAEYRDVEIAQDVPRSIPVPVECVTTVEYKLPHIKPRYERVPVPIYAPRFIEVAVPVEQMDEQTAITSDQLAAQVAMIAASGAPSLCEIERLAEMTKNFQPEIENRQETIQLAWQESALAAHESGQMTITTHPRRPGAERSRQASAVTTTNFSMQLPSTLPIGSKSVK